jgi:hypothetical protein
LAGEDERVFEFGRDDLEHLLNGGFLVLLEGGDEVGVTGSEGGEFLENEVEEHWGDDQGGLIFGREVGGCDEEFGE